jgi:hypothetical protein
VELDQYHQFGEEDAKGSNLAEIADQLPATTFGAFAWEFVTKLPELIFDRKGGSVYGKN